MLIRARAVDPRLAVVLNGRARGVSPGLVRRLRRMVPGGDLYVSRSLDESRAIAAAIVERRYPAVLFGGGDGTFVQCLADLRDEAHANRAPLPSVGVLKLGTGNALACALGASPPTEAGLRRDLVRAQLGAGTSELNLLEVEGRPTPFAGAGLDAQILDDFGATTRALDTLGLGRALGAGARYALAVALRSTPRYLVREVPEVVAVNLGSTAIRVGAGGRAIAEVPRGGVLYRGRCSLAAGATIPYYGLGMKMFPYAQARRDRFQLRCASASTAEILGNLPAIWRGAYASDSVADFLVDEVELIFERPSPVQIGGDLQPGARERLVLSLSKRPITVLA